MWGVTFFSKGAFSLSVWVETYYCIPDQKATTVADCFVDLISRFGVPKSILTDKGTNFESALVRRICEMLGITKLRCTDAHPQTNGQTERFNRTLCDMLTHYVNENQSDWDRWVGVCASAFRFSRHTTTGYSPFELVYGAEPRVPVVSEMLDDASELRCGTYGQYVDGLKRRLSVDRAQAHKSLVERQTRSSVPSASDIQLGDKVMLKVHAVKRGHVKKLSKRFEGPYVVAEVRRPDYVIKRGRKTRFVHGSNIKKVHASICDDADTPDRPRSVPTTVQNELQWNGVPSGVTSFPVTFEREVSAESDSEPRRAERASQPAEPRRASVSSASADVDGGSSASSIVDDSDDGDVHSACCQRAGVCYPWWQAIEACRALFTVKIAGSARPLSFRRGGCCRPAVLSRL